MMWGQHFFFLVRKKNNWNHKFKGKVLRKICEPFHSLRVPYWRVKSSGIRQSKMYKCHLALTRDRERVKILYIKSIYDLSVNWITGFWTAWIMVKPIVSLFLNPSMLQPTFPNPPCHFLFKFCQVFHHNHAPLLHHSGGMSFNLLC